MTDKLLSKISVFLLLSLFSFAVGNLVSGVLIEGNAQSVDQSCQLLLDRDKNVPKEKVEKAFAEAKGIQEAILKMIRQNKSHFVLASVNNPHLIYDIPGQRATTRSELSWRKGKTNLQIYVELMKNNKDAVASFRFGMDAIAMGEFFDAPEFGEEARLVKNVEFNKRSTNVGLHFVKGRAKVSFYIYNFGRSTSKNEKELLEIARLINPLIVARPNFDDK